jgi:hypothetical protein
LAYGTFTETRAGPGFYYNTTIQSSPGGLTWSDLHFHVQSASGDVLSGASTITVTNSANTCDVALYTFSNASWTVPETPCVSGTIGGSAPVWSGSSIQVLSAVNFTASGDALAIVGQGAFEGTSTVSIP